MCYRTHRDILGDLMLDDIEKQFIVTADDINISSFREFGLISLEFVKRLRGCIEKEAPMHLKETVWTYENLKILGENWSVIFEAEDISEGLVIVGALIDEFDCVMQEVVASNLFVVDWV